MKLPDFLVFEPFNQLREAMGAEKLGGFVFFDSRLHLRQDELDLLRGPGLPTTVSDCRVLTDKTLAIKDSRVLVLEPVTGAIPESAPDLVAGSGVRYHLADCEHVRGMRTCGTNILVVAPYLYSVDKPTQGKADIIPQALVDAQVCFDCLHVLHYQGLGYGRQRHQHYNAEVQAQFSLLAWCQKYPIYPLALLTEPVF